MTTFIGKSAVLWNALTLYLGRCRLFADGQTLRVKWTYKQRRYDVLDISEAHTRSGLLGSTLSIVHTSGVFKIFGTEKATEANLRKFIEAQIINILRANQESINSCWQMRDDLYRSDTYISTSKKESFRQEWRQKFDEKFFVLIEKLSQSTFLDQSQPEVMPALNKIRGLLKLNIHFDESIQQRNENFVQKELDVHRRMFDQVEKLPLTREQRLAAVYFDDVNVLVASAGSGKTSSLVGKAIYALTKKYYGPHEILMLAFAKEAADGLESRFTEALSRQQTGWGLPIIKTFHSLGTGIIQTVEGKKAKLAPWASNDDLYKELLSELTDEICQDASLNAELTLVVSTLMFGNATSYDQRVDYKELLQRKSPDSWEIRAEIRERNPYLRTLRGEMVRSQEELMIANWLSLHGINYVYEKALENPGDESRLPTRFKPDFYYPDVNVYHEHFALDTHGKAPPFFGSGYEPGVQWKRDFFAETKTNFFETQSWMFQDGSIYKVLKDNLQKFGLNPQLKKLDSAKEEFIEARKSLMNIVATVIKQIRNQGRSAKNLEVANSDYLSRSFHNLISAVLLKYEDFLKQKQVLDFEEMLIKASAYVENGAYRSPFKFVCIDEFQDISQGRRRLAKAILDQRKGATLFAVGDDWQGIYRFAGADLDIFTHASKYFGATQELLLTNTFRSNQGIADLAAAFVQKNPIQKKKLVHAHDKNRRHVLKVVNYDRENQAHLAIEKEIKTLGEDLRAKGNTATVFILARYNFLQPHHSKIRDWEKACGNVLEISTMSFHSSKGLEAEYVFILGMNNGPFGFPSIKNDHPFIQMYMAEAEAFPYAEERRLFYVALTRAKRKVFLLTRSGIPSVFLQELYDLPNSATYFDF